MKATLLILGLALSAATAEPVSIFNGENLDGWKSDAEGDFAYWTVKDGVIQCQSGPEKKESYLWTEKGYADYTLTLEYKYGEGSIDSGVMLRDMGDQIQIGHSGSLKRDLSGSPYIPKDGYPVEATEAMEAQKMDDWNTLKIEVKGDTYRTWINGVEGITYKSETATEKGKIGLQLHSGREMAIQFRNIEIEEPTEK